jgi:hypothetical protein
MAARKSELTWYGDPSIGLVLSSGAVGFMHCNCRFAYIKTITLHPSRSLLNTSTKMEILTRLFRIFSWKSKNINHQTAGYCLVRYTNCILQYYGRNFCGKYDELKLYWMVLFTIQSDWILPASRTIQSVMVFTEAQSASVFSLHNNYCWKACAVKILWRGVRKPVCKMSIARQRLVKDDCWATLGKQCLKAGVLKSGNNRDVHFQATAT